jgi:ubiquinone/menaquinone biosynthesis C-methylase UbiE
VSAVQNGPWGFLLYVVLPHPVKMALLSPELIGRLDRVNLAVNVAMYSGSGASEYDQTHRYAEAEHHEYPARPLVEDIWPGAGYGSVLELGAGTGYFTRIIARRAQSVIAVEPVPDMQRVLRASCMTDGLSNVEIVGAAAADLPRHVPEASIDTALIIQSLHHLHRRPEVFEALGRVVRPGGQLLMVEPHHNLRRVVRLVRKWVKYYRRQAFWSNEMNWATHDFLTCRELSGLCRHGGFEPPRISGYWIPSLGRLMREPAARFRLERRLGRVSLIRHFAGVLAVEARRRSAACQAPRVTATPEPFSLGPR